jgi:cytosine permease
MPAEPHYPLCFQKSLTILLGVLGGLLALAGVWSLFLNWLNLLGIFVPPIGAVIIVDQMLIRHYSQTQAVDDFRASAFLAWGAGAVVAVLVHYLAPWFSEALAGMLVGGAVYYVLSRTAGRAVRQSGGVI